MMYEQNFIIVDGKKFCDVRELKNYLGEFSGIILHRSNSVQLKISSSMMTMIKFADTNLPRRKKIIIFMNGKLYDGCPISLMKIFSHGMIILYCPNRLDNAGELPFVSAEINEIARLEKNKLGSFPSKFHEVRFNGEIIKDFSVIKEFLSSKKVLPVISLFNGENKSLDIRYDYIYNGYAPIFTDGEDGEFFEVTARTIFAAIEILSEMRVKILGVKWGIEKFGYNIFYSDLIFRGNKKIEVVWINMQPLVDMLADPFNKDILIHPDNEDPILKQFVRNRNSDVMSIC